MYGVYAPDADTLRTVLDRPKRLLGYPHCAYLVCLARSVDASAVEFLKRFGAAVDHETGESLAFIVLLDDATVLGTYDPLGYHQRERTESLHRYAGWPSSSKHFSDSTFSSRLPSFDVPQTVEGGLELKEAIARRLKPGSIPDQAYYRGSPEWSLKFAEHVDLDRRYLPCILAFDDPAASEDESCVVIPLQDPAVAWEIIVDAISNFVMQPDVKVFIRAAERLRKAEHELQAANWHVCRIEDKIADIKAAVGRCKVVPARREVHHALVRARSILGNLPSAPKGLLGWASSLSDEDRSSVSAAAHLADGSNGDAAILLAMLNSPSETRSSHECYQVIRRLRGQWLRVTGIEEDPHIRNMLHAQLAEGLRLLGRPPEDLAHVLSMDAADKQSFIKNLEDLVPFGKTDVHDAWSVLTEKVRPHVVKAVCSEEISRLQAELDASRQNISTVSSHRDAAMAALRSTKMVPFLPHLAGSVEQAIQTAWPAGYVANNSRPRIARAAVATAGGTGFLASVVQILQGIGVLK